LRAPLPDDAYAHFARQLLLPEVGPEGQARLAASPVRFEGFSPWCARLHHLAGGATDPGSGLVVRAPGAAGGPVGPAEALCLDAFGAIEAGRRALGEAPRELPPRLAARLGL
jgi:hypothetical protein